jgi:ATP-dependent DNA helicase RecG
MKTLCAFANTSGGTMEIGKNDDGQAIGVSAIAKLLEDLPNTGSALDEFMLRKQGKTWDGVLVPYVSVNDFESDGFKVFRRKAVESTRLKSEDLQITDETLLSTLGLYRRKLFDTGRAFAFPSRP